MFSEPPPAAPRSPPFREIAWWDLGAMWTLSQQLGSLRFRPASRRRWCCWSTDHAPNRPQITLRQLSGIPDKAPQHSGVTIPRPQTITLQEPLLVGVELGARITEQRKREPSKAVFPAEADQGRPSQRGTENGDSVTGARNSSSGRVSGFRSRRRYLLVGRLVLRHVT